MDSQSTALHTSSTETTFTVGDALALAWGVHHASFVWTAQTQRSAIAAILFSTSTADREVANEEHEA